MITRIIRLSLLLMILAGCERIGMKDCTHYVDPFIGTDGHGHTFPGATVPFGMVQLSPDTRKDNWDACSGYHYSDSTIAGFSHTHLSGTGVGDYGDIRIMPVRGDLRLNPGDEKDPSSGYRSSFSHAKESATPGYYQVFLEDYGIDVELTSTRRCGFHKYTVPKEGPVHIIIDLFESVTSDEVLEAGIEIVNDCEISGFRRTKGWAEDQVVYFYAVFSEPFSESGIAHMGIADQTARKSEGQNLQAYVSYNTRKWDELYIKVGISAVSQVGARLNLEQEIIGWHFDDICREAKAEWNQELSKVKVETGDDSDKVKFYTALYHSFIAPNLFSDTDGSYRGHDRKIHNDKVHEQYTVFSLWDTYRALHPLLTLLQPEKTAHFLNTLTDIFDKGGLLPVWELAGNETFCMIGYHSVPVIADALMKGYQEFDIEKAYIAMKHSANSEQFGLRAYMQNGYIPADEEGESISRTLEYAYDDWCIAMTAKKLHKEEDYRNFLVRAQSYKNLFDPETGFIRGKRNSMFVEPFNPAEVNFMLTEANTWQYTFYVPQDIRGLMDLMGGRDAFTLKLDEMFSTSSELTGREQADITGLIGQYAHGNEPSHHMAYLYNFTGQPFKTQELVRQIMDDLYGTGPAGLCGNEDCGQMSAWFVFSAMGFYPVTPASNIYIIGSPLFEEASIDLPGGKRFTVRANNNSPENIYIQSAVLNDTPLTKSFLRHEELAAGGMLLLEMGPRPSATWGTKQEDLPVSEIVDFLITPVPYMKASGKTFQDSISVSLHNALPDAELFYRAGGQVMDGISALYESSIHRAETFQLSAVAVRDPLMTSLPAHATFRKIHHLWSVILKSEYSSQYTGGGDMAIIDGETGGENFRTGGWQGYQGVDFEAVIDLGRKQSVKRMGARFLNDQNAWIFLPEQVEIAVSGIDGQYHTIALIAEPVTDSPIPNVKEFSISGDWKSVRYIKITAKNTGDCPAWHKGAGGRAWLFIDEITVE